jgi:hypothetical protein
VKFGTSQKDFNTEAMHLKMDLATDQRLPKAVRDAPNGPMEASTNAAAMSARSGYVRFRVNK